MSLIERLEHSITPHLALHVEENLQDSITELSHKRVSLLLETLPLLQELYLDLDELTATMQLKDGHILTDAKVATHLYNLLHQVYLKVKHDDYFMYLLFGQTQVPTDKMGAVYHRYGKASVNPLLYALIQIEKECKRTLKLLVLAEQLALDYVLKRVDNELLKEFVEACKRSRSVLFGLFDMPTHLMRANVTEFSLQGWFADINYFNLYTEQTKHKLDIVFELTLCQAKNLHGPLTQFMQTLNREPQKTENN